ncbi:acetate--CoA ligase family protein [Kribbella speibonae]|uniref:CoA-binding protein n=1 Tax=Kribbella speibonae TaxID=1572660 RepID=A0A4R0I9E2_9ACTN|nr:acetate--CoA ligase family protein [Kribbella speibonae]TCC28889.1 CoA-binding protein [Kribbella speibonae]
MKGLDGLFTPRGVAVIGASRNPAKLGAVMARSLSTYGAPLALVNPRDPELHGSVAEAVDSLGAPIDLAVVCVPAAAAADAVAEAAKAGASAALVCAGGFAEAGHPEYQRALVDVVERHGIRLLGPNTSGFLVPGRGLTASFVPSVASVPAGGVAVVAASGGVNHALSFLLAEAGYGVSLAVGLGNAADVDAADVLDHLVVDPATKAVALHIESVADGSRLAGAVARLSAVKPVVALVVGRNDVGAFAKSHTGALATSWRTTRGVLRQSGAVLVDDERQLVDAVGALSMIRLNPGAVRPGVGLVTAQAGPGLLVLDGLRGAGIRVPVLADETQRRLGEQLPPMTYQANPVDTGRPGPGFGEVVRTVGDDPAVDLVAVYALTEPDSVDLAVELSPQIAPTPTVVAVGGSTADVTAVRSGLHERGYPVATSPAALTHAVRALVEDACLNQRRGTNEPLPPVAVQHGPWDEHQAKTVLDALGIHTPPRAACTTAEEAHAALDFLGAPIALKILDATILHKTEIGGVHLGIRTHADLQEALDALGAERVLVERMAPAGVDLIVGARRDPVFGPVVLVGLGGTTAEALGDVAVRAAPLSVAEAASMVDELIGRALLDGWRGGPVLDREELATVVRALGQVLLDSPRVDEIEINPLRLTRDGLVALDAVITGKEH